MKTLNKMLFIAVLAGSTLFFISCLSSDGENSQTFASEPLVVNTSAFSTTTTVASRYGTFYAPQLSDQYSNGMCLAANFKIDFDNQTASDYYTITEVEVLGQIPSGPPSQTTDSVITGYDKPIRGITPVLDNTSRISLINNRIFLTMKQDGLDGKNFTYQMVWTTSGFTHNGYPTLYISAKPEAAAAAVSSEDSYSYAFNLAGFNNFCLGETTESNKYVEEITENGYTYYKLQFHIKYRIKDKTEEGEEGEEDKVTPEFKLLSSSGSSPYSVVWLKP